MRPLIDGKYEILEKIKEGGMGAIYRVRHVFLEEVRVVKTIKAGLDDDPESRKRFYKEARLATALKHPNIAALLDFIEDRDHTFYMVMEYIEGASLSELLGVRGAPALGTAVEIGMQTLDALGYLHSKGIVHRDISPENVMLTVDGAGRLTAKLIDLGVAKEMETSGQTMTMTGMFVGKLRYGSPEQLGVLKKGERIDGRSDLYSLGCVLFQAFSGQPAFQADSPQQYVMQHVVHGPRKFDVADPGGRVPAGLRDVVTKSLSKDRNDRYPDARAFAVALRAAAEAAGVLGQKDDPAELARLFTELRDAAAREREEAERKRAAERPPDESSATGLSTQQERMAQAIRDAATPPSLSGVALEAPTVRTDGDDGIPTARLEREERPTIVTTPPPGRSLRTPRPAPIPTAPTPTPAPRETLSTPATPMPGPAHGAATAKLWLLVGAAASVLVGAVVTAILMRRPPPPPAPTGPAPGALLLTAAPWASVARIQDLDRGVDAPVAGETTPVRLALAPGRWRITLRGPSGAEASVEATVGSGAEVPRHVTLPGFDLDATVRSYVP